MTLAQFSYHAGMTDPHVWDVMPVTSPSRDLRDLLRIGQTTVSLRLWQGKIPGYLLGRSCTAFRTEVRKWLESTANGTGSVHGPDPDPLDACGGGTVSEMVGLFGMSRQSVMGWLRDGAVFRRFAGRRWSVEPVAIGDLVGEVGNRP